MSWRSERLCGVGLVVPLATGKAMAPFRRTAANAASLPGFIRMGVAALGTVSMGALHEGAVQDIHRVPGLPGVAVLVFGSSLWLEQPDG